MTFGTSNSVALYNPGVSRNINYIFNADVCRDKVVVVAQSVNTLLIYTLFK